MECQVDGNVEIKGNTIQQQQSDCTVTAEQQKQQTICIVSQEHWNTLRWEERTGAQTLEVQFWDNSQVKDTNPQEFWKYCKPKFREQLHVTSPPEVHKAVQTLHRFAHKKLCQAENLQKFRKLSPSTTTSEKTPYRH